MTQQFQHSRQAHFTTWVLGQVEFWRMLGHPGSSQAILEDRRNCNAFMQMGVCHLTIYLCTILCTIRPIFCTDYVIDISFSQFSDSDFMDYSTKQFRLPNVTFSKKWFVFAKCLYVRIESTTLVRRKPLFRPTKSYPNYIKISNIQPELTLLATAFLDATLRSSFLNFSKTWPSTNKWLWLQVQI